MIIYLPLDRGFSFRPFLVLPKRVKGKKSEAGYRAHERVHYNRQWWFPVIWVIRYYLSKKFRWQEEKLAWTEQIKADLKAGHKVTNKRYVEILSTQYWGMVSYKDALNFMENVWNLQRLTTK